MGNRIAIADAIRTKLLASADLATLTGASADDKRIYPGFDKVEHRLTDTQPGFISVFHITAATPVLDRESRRYQVSCFAKRHKVASDMADAVDDALHLQSLSAVGWTDVSLQRVGETSVYDDGAGSFQANLDFEAKVF